MPQFPINEDSSFRDNLARAIIIEAQPTYDGDSLGWHYCDPLGGYVWHWIPPNDKPWPPDCWCVTGIETIVNTGDLNLDIGAVDWAYELEGENIRMYDLLVDWAISQGYDSSQYLADDQQSLQPWVLADDVETDALTWATTSQKYAETIKTIQDNGVTRMVSKVLPCIMDYISVNIEGHFNEAFENMPSAA